MTKLSKKFNFKAFLTLLTVFTLSFVLALSTACSSGNDSSSGSSSSSSADDTPKDEQTIKNGDFEFNTTEDTKFPYSSSIKWSRSYDGSSTGSYGGIIDVSAAAYEKLAEANIPKDGETSFNPGTPLTEDDADTEANEAGTKILMLRNDSADKGAAQYYTSSTSVTLNKEEYARISVWVNTYGVTVPLGYEGGAYIKVKTGVDDKAPLLIKNINTGSTVGENGSKWVKYTIYVAPSVTAQTKLTVVVGFGSGSSANENRVNGFAYFDNVEYKVVDEEDYKAAVNSADEKVSYYAADNTVQKETLTLDAANDGANKTVSLSLAKNLSSADVSVDGNVAYNKINFATGATNKPNNTADYTLDQKTIGEESFENAVYMDFTSVKNSATYTSGEFTVKKAKYTDGKKDDDNCNYAAFSFLAKVKTKSAATTNASVQIIESTSYGENVTGSFASFTTDGEYKRYTFYLTTNYEEDRTFRVRFNFGPTNEKGALPEVSALPQGYAVFTDFSFTSVTKDEYTDADTTNSTKVALLGDHVADHVEDADDETTDSYSFRLSKADEFDLANAPVSLRQTIDKTLSVLKSGEGATAGVVNSKYSYSTFAGLDEALSVLKSSIQGDNKNVQPLFVKNTIESEELLLGGNTVTVTANTVYKFSVKVRVISGKAFVRLFEVAGVDGTDEVVTLKNYSANTEVTTETFKFKDGYAYIQYIIKAGDKDKNIRIEMGVNGVGSALFDTVDAGSSASYSDTESFQSAEDYRDYKFGAAIEEKIGDEENKVYYYAKKSDFGDLSKRIKDDDGNYKFVVKDPVKVIAFGTPDNGDATYENSTVKYFRFDTDSMKYEIETSSSDGDSSSDSSSSSSSNSSSASETVGNYAWLQIVSIIIAAVIIIALVAVIVRKALEGRKSKKAKTKAYYGGYNQKTAKTDGHRYSVKNAKNAAAKAESKADKKSDVKVVDLDESDKEEAYDYGDGKDETETPDGGKDE